MIHDTGSQLRMPQETKTYMEINNKHNKQTKQKQKEFFFDTTPSRILHRIRS